MSLPSFSIAIPAMNEETLLPKLFASLKVQSLQPDEVIIADADSTDRTREICQEYGATVVEGGLPSVGRNAAAAKATSEVILFLDADVELRDSEYLKRALEEFVEREFDIVTADISPMTTHWYDHVTHWVYNKYVRAWGARFAHAPGYFIMTKRSLHEKIGGFDETIRFCEDMEYVQRASKQGRFGFLNSVKIPMSVRRYDRDGRLNIAWKFLRAELHLMFKGPIRDDRFHYTFGYGPDDRKK